MKIYVTVIFFEGRRRYRGANVLLTMARLTPNNNDFSTHLSVFRIYRAVRNCLAEVLAENTVGGNTDNLAAI